MTVQKYGGLKKWIPTAVLILVAAAAVFSVCLHVELYADDFFYSTFTRDGFATFLQKNAEHYRTFNGRVIVHLLVQILLAVGTWGYAFFVTVLLLLIPWLGAGVPFGQERARRLPAVLFFLLLFMLIGSSVLGESVFWISASCNYLYPFLMTVFAYRIGLWLFDGSHSPSALIGGAVLAFLCGATTEQCGIFSVFVLAAAAVKSFSVSKTKRTAYVLLPISAFCGYVTIFLSPATLRRLYSETVRTSISARMAGLASLLFESGVAILLFVFLFVIFLAAMTVPDFPKIGFFALPCGVLVALLLFIDGGAVVRFSALVLFAVYAVVLALGLYGSKRFSWAGIFLAAGLGELLIMGGTSSLAPRTALPFALSLCLVGAILMAELLCDRHPAVMISSMAAAFCVSLAVFAPTMAGYASNAALRDENAARIEEARTTGILHYRIDYDARYAHSLMYADGFFYNTFFDCHRLSCTEVYLESEQMPPVYAAGKRMTSPAYLYEGALYFPVENIITALGGSISWTPKRTDFQLGERQAYLIGDTLYADGREWNITEERAYGYYTLCFSERILAECFGIRLSYDEDAAVYTAIVSADE